MVENHGDAGNNTVELVVARAVGDRWAEAENVDNVSEITVSLLLEESRVVGEEDDGVDNKVSKIRTDRDTEAKESVGEDFGNVGDIILQVVAIQAVEKIWAVEEDHDDMRPFRLWTRNGRRRWAMATLSPIWRKWWS